MLSRQLRGNGYQTTLDGALQESLKGVRTESVLFLNTHGGDTIVPKFGNDGKPTRGNDGKIVYYIDYGLWTGTKIDPKKTDISYSHEEFLDELKAVRAEKGNLRFTPIIMITSRTAGKHRERASELGVDVFLGKPYEESALLRHIDALARRPEAL